ncbi:MAG TPA: hypothetical protein PLX23_03290 [Candidatus Hydrogenedens sp.]|nr:hypothetical protein [Candidatus Hydrogenedens sp.]
MKLFYHIFLLSFTLFYSITVYAEEGILAGSATADITPPVGKEMPGGFEKSLAQGIHDPLEVNAVILKSGEQVVALVSIDALMIPDELVSSVREKVSKSLPIPPQNIIFAASHTHHGGPIIDVLSSEHDPEYCSFVKEKIFEIVSTAWNNITKVKIGVNAGEQEGIAFNRRFYMKDGTVVTHPGRRNPDIIAPAGPIDPQVIAMFLIKEDGSLLSAVVNYALHGTVFSGNSYSADYIHYLRAFLRKQWNSPVPIVFLNGACGDVTQVNNLGEGTRGEFGEVWAKRIGETLACKVYKLSLWTDYTDSVPINTASEIITVNFRDIDNLQYQAKAGLGSSQEKIYERERQLLKEIKEKQNGKQELEISAIRIGDVAIVCNPTELFCQLGLNIKKSSPAKYTIISELSNGYAGYCPTPEAFEEGGYEILTARSSFMEPNAGIKIVQASRKLLAQLFSDSQTEK